MSVITIGSVIGSAVAIIGVLWRLGEKVSGPFTRWARQIESSTTETLRQIADVHRKIADVHEELAKVITDHENRITRLERKPSEAGHDRRSPRPN